MITGDATQKGTFRPGQVSASLMWRQKVRNDIEDIMYLSPYQQGRCTSSTGYKKAVKAYEDYEKQTKSSRVMTQNTKEKDKRRKS